MLGSVLAFTPEKADGVSLYCEDKSENLPAHLKEHWEYTSKTFLKDADKMSSLLQGQWMIWVAKEKKPKRILEIGCFSGYSALAWYEGTKDTKAEIITLELLPEMIEASQKAFEKYGVTDRVRIIPGPAGESLQKLSGEFDLIFVDANKDGYEGYVKTILDKKLLSKNGLILCDNVFARGLTIGPDYNPHLDNESKREYWLANGKALDKFNTYVKNDPRVDVVVLPLFDGVSQIRWKS